MTPRRKCDFLLRKHLNLVPNYIDTPTHHNRRRKWKWKKKTKEEPAASHINIPIIRSIQLQNSFAIIGAEKHVSKSQNAGGFTRSRRTLLHIKQTAHIFPVNTKNASFIYQWTDNRKWFKTLKVTSFTLKIYTRDKPNSPRSDWDWRIKKGVNLTAKIRLGMLPSRAMTWSLETASSFPTISTTLLGLYFSEETNQPSFRIHVAHSQNAKTMYLTCIIWYTIP